jgi:hypothetical protein
MNVLRKLNQLKTAEENESVVEKLLKERGAGAEVEDDDGGQYCDDYNDDRQERLFLPLPMNPRFVFDTMAFCIDGGRKNYCEDIIRMMEANIRIPQRVIEVYKARVVEMEDDVVEEDVAAWSGGDTDWGADDDDDTFFAMEDDGDYFAQGDDAGEGRKEAGEGVGEGLK